MDFTATGTDPNNSSLKKFSISFFSRMFNIAPTQWSRVMECWLVSLFFKVGAAIGWTILTAAFVSKFGIRFLPLLFIFNAVLIVGSTLFFENLVMRIKKEILMTHILVCAILCLFIASFVYERSVFAFFALVIFAESVFLAQFNVFLPLFVGDKFTPMESQKTFPFVESGENMGGMVGGAIVGLFASEFPITLFIYIWIIFLILVILIFVIKEHFSKNLPKLPFNDYSSHKIRRKDQVKLVLKSLKKMPFLKGLIAMVLLQWVFMNVLEFQFTKAIEQAVTGKPESTIVHVDPHVFQVSILKSPEGVKSLEKNAGRGRALSAKEQSDLTKKMGSLKSFFHFGALVMQIFLASRLISMLGIVGSLLLHPIIVLMSLVGMFLKFNLTSAIITKANFEITNIVHKNAYLASHYAFPKSIRDQAAEFIEGMVRPIGTIVGMLFIIILQFLISGKELTLWIHISMSFIMLAVLFITLKLQSKYTDISKEQLFSELPYPEKLNAIEILSQRGHKDAHMILIDKLNESSANAEAESPIVRLKLISALAEFKDYSTVPEFVNALYDPNPDIRLEAANALMNFYDIGNKFYLQAFSRYRLIESLKEVFKNETSSSVRSAIIRLFSLLNQPDTVSFLLNVLKDSNPNIRADCIYTLGLFRDPSAAYYILPYLNDENPSVRANAIIALWQFQKYRPMLKRMLDNMIEHPRLDVVKEGIFALGEIECARKNLLLKFISHHNPEIQLEAAFALTKIEDQNGFAILLHRSLYAPEDEFESMRRFVHKMKFKSRKMINAVVAHAISSELNELIHHHSIQTIDEMDPRTLEKLRRLYRILDQHEELYAIENMLKKQIINN